MDCPDVRDRLTALEDGELGPSEEALTRAHLAGCARCHDLHSRLAAVVPRADLAIPDALRRRLASLDGATVLRLAAERPEPAAAPRRRPLSISRPAALAYGALLAVTLGWGLANWRERARLEAQIAESRPNVAAPEIPAGDYRPAAWTPGPAPESP